MTAIPMPARIKGWQAFWLAVLILWIAFAPIQFWEWVGKIVR